MRRSLSVGSAIAEMAISSGPHVEDRSDPKKRQRQQLHARTGSETSTEEEPDAEEETGEEDIRVEITTGEGATEKFQMPHMATVLMVKQFMEIKCGITLRDARIFASDETCEDELRNDEMLRSFVTTTTAGAKVEMLLLVDKSDALQVVPAMPAKADVVLLEPGENGQIVDPAGVAFVPNHPNWLVTTKFPDWLETSEGRDNQIPCVTITDIHTRALVCKFGEEGDGEGQFNGPEGVAVTPDSSFVLIADYNNHLIQVLQLVVSENDSAHLEFVRSIGSKDANGVGRLASPAGVALLPSEGGQDTVLVTEVDRDRVTQFAFDGTFMRTFVGSGERGDGNGTYTTLTHHAHTPRSYTILIATPHSHTLLGELYGPWGITVLSMTGEVAIADRNNHRVQLFDREGKYLRQFGSKGDTVDGKFNHPSGNCHALYTAMHCTLPYTALHCHTLCTVHCHTLLYTAIHCCTLPCTALHCHTLLYTAMHCFTLPYTALHCHALGLASDVYGNLLVLDITNRLQVFTPKGKHLCTRDDLGLTGGCTKDIAWNEAGGVAVANTNAHDVLIWGGQTGD
jgi:DNA-binding beta-propeller fold protein YncE